MSVAVERLPGPYDVSPPRPIAWTRTPVIDRIDFLYMAFVFFAASDAFSFLGLHSIFWLLAYGYAILRIATSFPAYVTMLGRNWIFLLYPALCTISVLWSAIPGETLRFSVQLTFSVLIAAFIGMRFTLMQIFVALALVLFVLVLASLANLNGALTSAFDHRGNFKGIFLSKNALGHRTVMLSAICAFGIFLIPGLRPSTRLALVVALGINAFLISISGSATAVALSGVLMMTGLLIWILLGQRGGWSVVFALATLPVAVVIFVYVGLQLNLMAELLQALGRDPTLTGRTVLWDFAARHLDAHPILGFGASGFWNHPDVQNEIIALQGRYGEGVTGFHNVVLELLIMLGPLGLAVHTMAIGLTMYRAVRRTRDRDDALAAWALTITLGMYVMAMFGPQLFQQHAIPLILVVALGISLSHDDPPPNAVQAYRGMNWAGPKSSMVLDRNMMDCGQNGSATAESQTSSPT